MTTVNFKEVRDRFIHIDAEFVSWTCEFPEGHSELVVRFYPWWEHPLYIEAVTEGKPWGFAPDRDEPAKEVRVFPTGLMAFRLGRKPEVTEWEFVEDHPLLWDFENPQDIFCNSDFDMKELIERVEAARVPFVERQDLFRYLNPYNPYTAPFVIPRLPRSLFITVRQALEAMNVRIYFDREPEPGDPLVVLLLEDGDYIIAEDFDLDVPEFEHKDKWFCP